MIRAKWTVVKFGAARRVTEVTLHNSYELAQSYLVSDMLNEVNNKELAGLTPKTDVSHLDSDDCASLSCEEEEYCYTWQIVKVSE